MLAVRGAVAKCCGNATLISTWPGAQRPFIFHLPYRSPHQFGKTTRPYALRVKAYFVMWITFTGHSPQAAERAVVDPVVQKQCL